MASGSKIPSSSKLALIVSVLIGLGSVGLWIVENGDPVTRGAAGLAEDLSFQVQDLYRVEMVGTEVRMVWFDKMTAWKVLLLVGGLSAWLIILASHNSAATLPTKGQNVRAGWRFYRNTGLILLMAPFAAVIYAVVLSNIVSFALQAFGVIVGILASAFSAMLSGLLAIKGLAAVLELVEAGKAARVLISARTQQTSPQAMPPAVGEAQANDEHKPV